jgi:DNA ligase-1
MSTFIRLAELGEILAATKKKLAHRAMISEYLKSLDITEVPVASRLIIGRVFPESDPRILNMSGAAVSRVVEQIAGAPIDWQAIGGAVDFGEAVQKWLELRRHTAQGEPLHLMEVYAAYEAIAEDAGAGSRDRKTQRVQSLFQRASPLEAKYLTKHLVKEMRVGVSELSLLDAWRARGFCVEADAGAAGG